MSVKAKSVAAWSDLVATEGPAWLHRLRKDAMERLRASGFPGPKEEAWKHTDVALFAEPRPIAPPGAATDVPALVGTSHDTGRLQAPDDATDSASRGGDTSPARPAPLTVVLVDGYFRPELSKSSEVATAKNRASRKAGDDTSRGIEVLSLAKACQADREEASYHLGSTRHGRDDPFADLQTALWRDGAFVNVLPRTNNAAAVHIVHVATQPEAVCFPRVLVHVQEGAAVDVVEHFTGTGTVHALTELHAHPRSTLRHDVAQEVDSEGLVLHTVRATVEEGAHVAHHTVHLGAAHARTSLSAHLVGKSSEVDLRGLTLARASQHVDCLVHVDHAVPHTRSRQLYKGVLTGESRVAFTGNVLVRRGAAGTDAVQQNRNLLLSRGALADSTPQLEILADDVKCSHGSTVGQLDEDQLFFLRARGISRETAVRMLTRAFAAEIVDSISDASLRTHIGERFDDWSAAAQVTS